MMEHHEISALIGTYDKRIKNYITRSTEKVTISQGEFAKIQLSSRYYCDQEGFYNLDKLFLNSVQSFIDEHVRSLSDTNLPPEASLKMILEDFQGCLLYIHLFGKLLDYLDENYYKKGNQTTLHKQGLEKYEKYFKRSIAKQAAMAILRLIDAERLDEPINQLALKNTVKIFELISLTKKSLEIQRNENTGELYIPINFKRDEKDMESYRRLLEQMFIRESLNYYAGMIFTWSNSVVEYVRFSLKILRVEETRCINYFPSSLGNLMRELEMFLINRSSTDNKGNDLKITKLELGEAFEMVLHKEKVDDALIFYEFFSRSKYRRENDIEVGMRLLENSYRLFIEERGTKINNTEELKKNPLKYIEEVLKLLNFTKILERVIWNTCSIMNKGKREGFQNFLNKFPNAPIFLAVYTDIFMKARTLVLNDEVDEKIKDIITIFEFLFHKDVFFKKYLIYLGARLINETSQNYQVEESFVNHLKVCQGQLDVKKPSKMFEDIKESKKYTNELQLMSKNVFATFKILTDSFWELSETTEQIKIPPEMMNIVSHFSEYFNNKFQESRYLKWNYAYQTGEIKPLYARSYTFVANTFQMIILLNFNHKDSFTLEELIQRTGIRLCDEKYQPLINSLVTLSILIKEGDTFTLNLKFESKSNRVDVTTKLSISRPNQKPAELNNDLDELKTTRERMVDCSVVRIMKCRKTLKLNSLLEEVAHSITLFQCQPEIIKKRVESLIEREFIRRDEEDHKILIYMP